jgi:hypothetical protein
MKATIITKNGALLVRAKASCGSASRLVHLPLLPRTAEHQPIPLANLNMGPVERIRAFGMGSEWERRTIIFTSNYKFGPLERI